MLVAKVGGKYGFLNEEGKETVPFIYSQANDYSEGLAAVVNESGKYLFIDKLGNIAIKPKEYDRVGKFTNGTCKVYRKEKVWEIDREGKKVKDYKKKVGTADVDRSKSNDDTYVGKCNTTSQNEADTNSQYSNKRKKKSFLNILFGVENEANEPQSVYRTYPNREATRNRSESLRYRQNRFGNKQEQNWRKGPQQKRNSFGNIQKRQRP